MPPDIGSGDARHSALSVTDSTATLAAAHIDLAVRLADVCARPPRWRGNHGQGGPATSAFFLISAASADWVDAAEAHPRVRAIDVSIEAMAGFAATEASIATGRLQVVIAGAGPGTLGQLWAVPGARAQGATVLVLMPRTPPTRAGAHDIQESSDRQPLHLAGAAIFDETLLLEHVAQMPRIAMRLRHLFARPQGAFVALCVPTSMLREPCPPLPEIGTVEIALPAPSPSALTRIGDALIRSDGPPAFLLGSGCVPFRERLDKLITRCGALHFTTPAAIGILRGSLGAIGTSTHSHIARELREQGVRCVVVLGTRLGIASGGSDSELLPDGCQIVHVDIDPVGVVGNAAVAMGRPVLSVTADIGEFIDALGQLLPQHHAHKAAR